MYYKITTNNMTQGGKGQVLILVETAMSVTEETLCMAIVKTIKEITEARLNEKEEGVDEQRDFLKFLFLSYIIKFSNKDTNELLKQYTQIDHLQKWIMFNKS